jgi:chromosome segregation ATPase
MSNLDSFLNEIFELEILIKKKSEEVIDKLNYLTAKRAQLQDIKRQRIELNEKSIKLKENLLALETHFSVLNRREEFLKSKIKATNSLINELKNKLVIF